MSSDGRDAREDRFSEQAVVAVVYVLALFISILDSTVVNVALPTLSTELHVSTTSVEWAVTGYLLSLAVWIPASGWIGDRFGAKRVMLFALGVFTVASFLCGIATSFTELVAFRILQGVGGGMLTPVGLAMLFRAYPPERRAAASRLLVIPTAIAPATGPIIGGFLIDQLSWRWVFWVNIPIGIFAITFGALYLKERKDPAAGRFDVAGFALSAVGLASLLYALSQGPIVGWAAPRELLTMGVSLASFLALVVVELRIAAPMLQLRLLGERLFRACNTVSIFSSAAFLGLLYITPTFLQDVRGTSALQSGLTTFPEAVGVLSMSQLAGRLYPRFGPRRLMAVGLLGMSAAMVLLSTTDLSTSLWTIRLYMYVAGASFSFMIIALQAASFARVSADQMGRASAIFNAQRQTSAALGVALLATVLAAFLPGAHGALLAPAAQLGAYRRVFLTGAGIALVGVVAALRVHDTDAAGTMRGRQDPEAAMVH